MPTKFMQNAVVIPGETSVAPSSSHLANNNPLWFCLVVLVSAGIELTFFLVAGTVLRFGFSVRMMLITL